VTLQTIEGKPFTGVIGTFSDADPGALASDYTAAIDWGDGTTGPGTVAAIPGGGFQVTASHAWTEEGSRGIVVSITDAGGARANATSTATVADAALSSNGSGPILTLGPVGGTFARFVDADPGATASDYTATIDWGDGTSTTGAISPASGGGFQVAGRHTYRFGLLVSRTITVKISDKGGAATGATTYVLIL
jgi:hypothetical protein